MTDRARVRRILVLLLIPALVLVPVLGEPQSILPKLAAPSEAEPAEASEATEPAALTPEQTQAIAELLRDEAAREALIAELERLAARSGGTAADAPADAPTDSEAADIAEDDAAAAGEERLSFGRELAQETQAVAQELAVQAGVFWDRLRRAADVFAGLRDWRRGVLLEALIDLALVIALTVTLFLALRRLALRLYRWMGAKASTMGFFGTTLVYIASVIVDVLMVLVTWAVGYAAATAVFGEFGEIGIRQTLYLNAFLMVEMTKVAIRAMLSPATPELRPVNIPDRGARRMWNTLNIVTSLIGYGQFLLVPIVNQNIGYYAARSFSALLLLLALVILAASVIRYRRPVAAWLIDEDEGGGRRGFWRGLARYWHVPVLLYLAALFVIVVTRPGDVLLPVLAASSKILAAIVIGFVVGGLLTRGIARGVRLPESVNKPLPLLEHRLNAFVPRALFVLRLLIIAAVIGFTADTLGLIVLGRWLDTDAGVWLSTTLLSVALVVTFAFAVWVALTSWVDYRLNPDFGSVPTARESTLLSLLRNAVTIVLIVITLMFVLSEFGIDIAPLLASAGVIGLAIGFGAQKLVQDIITGIFIQLENAINVGDVITVAGTSGVVERLTIRSVSLRDLQGVYHIIPFSSVDMVANSMREFAFSVADIGIAYRESVDEAKQAMHDAFETLRADPAWGAAILGDLQWFGVESLADSAVVLRARIKTLPGQQWGVGRAYNEAIKRIFDERGIELPYPHRTLYFGEDKQGTTTQARIAITAVPPAEAPASVRPDAPES